MATWNFIIYEKTDFTSVDFNGNIVTSSTITPIFITIEDNDDWLGSASSFVDTNGQQTIVSSSDPSLVGQFIQLNQPVSPQDSNLVDTSGSPTITILDLSIGGADDYVMALEDNTNAELQPSTTYSDTAPGTGRSGINYAFNSVPCFAPGTMIDTPDGPRVVEALKAGDRVKTLDHGPQTIRWTSRATQALDTLEDDCRPIKIKAGALGPNLPRRDLVVSPQHRILVGGRGQLQHFFAREAFAAAKSLTGLPGISHIKSKGHITWVHFACERHEVITASGCQTESLLLGPMVVNGLPPATRQTLINVFGKAEHPELALNGPTARDCLTVGTARRIIALHEARTTAKLRKLNNRIAA